MPETLFSSNIRTPHPRYGFPCRAPQWVLCNLAAFQILRRFLESYKTIISPRIYENCFSTSLWSISLWNFYTSPGFPASPSFVSGITTAPKTRAFRPSLPRGSVSSSPVWSYTQPTSSLQRPSAARWPSVWDTASDLPPQFCPARSIFPG